MFALFELQKKTIFKSQMSPRLNGPIIRTYVCEKRLGKCECVLLLGYFVTISQGIIT